jgi:hypothetical protein
MLEWVRGDMSGLQIPAHSGALRVAGESFLTQAFRASGALPADNRVVAITQFEEWLGGSTGRKLLLSVAYESPAPELHTRLFVKFSRDFDDPIRDRSKRQMQSEVQFACMSRLPGFPIAVPACMFADYHQESGTGILITQRIAFGAGAIERHYDKCLDYEMPQPFEHYKALIRTIARLAGTHKAGGLSDDVARQFPFDANKLSVSERAPYTAIQLRNRVARYADFAARFPQLLPPDITSPTFIARLADEVARFPEHESAIRQLLHSRPELIALCHWNANVDNAWFWRNARGELECGLLDWGHVSQMNVAMALWGSLSAAEIELWDCHFEELLALFVAEFRSCGSPALDVEELKLHLWLYIALMGLAWLLDVPALVQTQMPSLAEVESRIDPRLKANEAARVRLQMMSTFLHLWKTRDFPAVLDQLLERTRSANAAWQ